MWFFPDFSEFFAFVFTAAETEIMTVNNEIRHLTLYTFTVRRRGKGLLPVPGAGVQKT
jgi:hypothetical protein